MERRHHREVQQPAVTIAMPCLNEADFIEACVRCVQAQTFPRDGIEIIVADGGSTDGTREILERLAREDARIRVIDNPQRIQSAGLNLAIRAARGRIIARMDVHADYAPKYIEKCVELLERTGADNVGGAARPRATSPTQRAVCAALASPLGFGGAAFRNPDAEGYVDTLFPGAFRREIFDKVGLFDEGAIVNEDAELNQRILQAGGRIYLSREIELYYYPRDSLAGLARQYFRYGQGRARTLLKHRRLRSLRPAAPFLGLVMLASTLLAAANLAAVALLLYGGCVLVEAKRQASRFRSPLAVTASAFPIMHFSHALGFGMGLVRFALWPNWSVTGAAHNRNAQGG
jgi:glycosyltransferase involved in cell wall biosynthesis